MENTTHTCYYNLVIGKFITASDLSAIPSFYPPVMGPKFYVDGIAQQMNDFLEEVRNSDILSDHLSVVISALLKSIGRVGIDAAIGAGKGDFEPSI